MAEFVDVMKTARRMCKSMDKCYVCPLHGLFDECCLQINKPYYYVDSYLARYEADIMKWGAENPESRYPTWQEWNDLNFPDADDYITPCDFMPKKKVEALMGKKCINLNCSQCIKFPIPADIAQKLGVKPIKVTLPNGVAANCTETTTAERDDK